jgi:DNA-binding transcriptional MerR regulator
MLDLHPDTIRRYERQGLVRSDRLRRERLYSERTVVRLRRIVSATGLGVNLSGADVICNLLERLEDKEREVQALREQLQRLLQT